MWIELSEFNFKLFIPLIFPVFKRIQSAVKKTFIIEENQIFKAFRYFTSYTLTFIFLIIIYVRTRKIRNENKENSKNDNLLENDIITVKSTGSNLGISIIIIDPNAQDTKKTKIKSVIFLSGLYFLQYYRIYFIKLSYFKTKII